MCVGDKYYLRHYSDNQTETVLFAKIGENFTKIRREYMKDEINR